MRAPSIHGAFRLFQKSEKLEPTDMWYCSKCKEHKEAMKQMCMWTAPKILVLHLKRFSFRNVLWKDKLDFAVDFPLSGLDISPFLPELDADGDTEPALYDLFAVANHHGRIWGGHYTAYCKVRFLRRDRRWRDGSDSCRFVFLRTR
eukprot:m.1145682 g.1145682  ORF g.1145682 m.1145682 type:complete len:146 (-) comp24465_c0_seq41:2959-3396(-)